MPSYLNYDGLQTLVSKIKYQVNSAAEKVKDTSSNKKAFLLGHESQNSIESAISDSSIYMENGALYAKEIKDVSAISHVSEKSGTKVFAANGTLFDAAPVVLLTKETSDDSNIVKYSFSEEDAEKIKTHASLKYKVNQGSDISNEIPAIQQTFIDDTIIDYLKTLGYTSATMDNVYLYVSTAVGMTSLNAHAAYAFLPDSKTAVLVKLTSDINYPNIEEQNKSVKYSIIGHDNNSDNFLYTGYVNDTSAYVLNGEIYSNGEKVLSSSLLNGSVTANDSSLVTGGDIYTAIQNQVGSAVKYLGTVTSAVEITALSSAKYGDFIRATKAFQFNNESVHIGDMIILDSSADEAYKTKDNWVIVHGEIDSWREVKVNGASKIAANNSQALDVSAGKNVTLSYTNNKVVINATNTDEKTTESGHYTPSTKKTSYGDSYPDTETVITKIDVDSKGHILGANEEINDPIIGGENILRCTQYPIVTVANIDNSWIHGKFVMSNINLDLAGHPYETTRVESPASTNREYCDAIILKDNAQYGVCQTVSNVYLDNLISHIERSLINLDNSLINAHTVKSIPFTFSFYAKMQDESTETSIIYTPIIAQDEEILKQASETSNLMYDDGWKKFSITRHVDIETIKNNGNLLGLGYVGNETETPVLIACPSLTIGKYDIDWKPNPLDAKSDIVGVGNILRCSTFQTDAYQTYYVNITDINAEDVVSSVHSEPQQLPGCESLADVSALVIGLSGNTYGISYREPGALFGNNSGWHTALMNYVGNTDTEIPVSMSIWCYSAISDIEVALMPVSFKGYDLFAPLTYVKVPAQQWTRLTRTIYVPAGITPSDVYLGSALATCSSGGNANVLFALPMVTLGSIPSTWFPSAWDLMNNTSCIDSTARNMATAAQNTANSAVNDISTALLNKANISDVTKKADKATTLNGYGITDAYIKDGSIVLGDSSIKPITSHQSLTGYFKDISVTGAGNAITAVTDNGSSTLSFTKGSSFAAYNHGHSSISSGSCSVSMDTSNVFIRDYSGNIALKTLSSYGGGLEFWANGSTRGSITKEGVRLFAPNSDNELKIIEKESYLAHGDKKVSLSEACSKLKFSDNSYISMDENCLHLANRTEVALETGNKYNNGVVKTITISPTQTDIRNAYNDSTGLKLTKTDTQCKFDGKGLTIDSSYSKLTADSSTILLAPEVHIGKTDSTTVAYYNGNPIDDILTLQMGSRNLLRGTRNIRAYIGLNNKTYYGYWRRGLFRKSGTGTVEDVSISDAPVYGCSNGILLTLPASGSTDIGICQDEYRRENDNEKYNSFPVSSTVCLSYWVKPSKANVSVRLQPIWDSLNDVASAGFKTITLTGGWQRVYYSGTTSSAVQNAQIGYIYLLTPDSSLLVCCPKLEFGNRPTDWTPAIEDGLIKKIYMTSNDALIYPNIRYVWGNVSGKLVVETYSYSDDPYSVNEYKIQFTPCKDPSTGASFGGLTIGGGIKWAGGSAPTFTMGHTYEISIIDNLATFLEFY